MAYRGCAREPDLKPLRSNYTLTRLKELKGRSSAIPIEANRA